MCAQGRGCVTKMSQSGVRLSTEPRKSLIFQNVRGLYLRMAESEGFEMAVFRACQENAHPEPKYWRPKELELLQEGDAIPCGAQEILCFRAGSGSLVAMMALLTSDSIEAKCQPTQSRPGQPALPSLVYVGSGNMQPIPFSSENEAAWTLHHRAHLGLEAVGVCGDLP